MSRKPPKERPFEVTVPVGFREYHRSLGESDEMKKSIDSLVESLEQTPLKVGAFVPKDKWPEEYKMMALGNVYKANLSKGARISYTVVLNRDGSGTVRMIDFRLLSNSQRLRQEVRI